MNCQQLASHVQDFQPDATPQDVARVCLLLTNNSDFDDLQTSDRLRDAWQEVGLRLQAATDQHAAMTEELIALAQSDPENFTKDQVWVLIRAIKVQSQVLQMYLGGQALDV